MRKKLLFDVYVPCLPSMASVAWTMLVMTITGCSQAEFAGSNGQRASQLVTPRICTSDDGVCVPPPPPVCKKGAKGAQIAFLIDNSTSNEKTDCPQPQASNRRKPNGESVFTCQGQSYREKAVLAAYDLLSKIAADEPDSALAMSAVAAVSFPLAENKGFRRQLAWTRTTASSRTNLVSALQFARSPWGQTPYGAAFKGAAELFAEASTDARQKVAILVTDGFPTDSNPAQVLAEADALRAQGVKVMTVSVTGAQDRASRQADHSKMLQSFDAANRQANGAGWYDAKQYPNFATYIDAIVGLGGQLAAGEVVEVQDAAALESAVLKLVGQSVECAS